jgi:hypothetical protein
MTRSSNINIGYLGKLPTDPRDSLAYRLAQRSSSKRRKTMIAGNVGELINILKSLDPRARIYTIEPPFDSLKIVEQGDGTFLFCRPREPVSKSQAVAPQPS